MKKFLKLFYFSLVVTTIFVLNFTVASAQSNECAKLKQQIEAAGGGRAANLPAYCNVSQVYTKVVNEVYYLIGIAAVISLIYAGYVYMTAGGNDTKTTTSKKIIQYTLAGLALALIATTLVNIVINLVVDNKFF